MEKDQSISPEELINETKEVSPEEKINETKEVSPEELINETKEVSPEELINETKKVSPEEKILELEDKIARAFAEMENQRRRFEKEREDAFNYGGFAFAKETLNLIDNL